MAIFCALDDVPGKGTQDDPIRNTQNRTHRPALECSDPLHNAREGRWFYPIMQSIHRCPFCCHDRPSKEALKDKVRKLQQRIARGEAKAEQSEVYLKVKKSVYDLFQAFATRLQPLLEAAEKLETVRVQREFGVYGRITCTEQELRLAQLDIATAETVNDPTYDLYLMLATGIPVDEILHMRQAGGRQPRYPEMRAFYQQQETSRSIQREVNETKKWLRKTHTVKKGGSDETEEVASLDPKTRAGMIGKLFDIEQKILANLPTPPKQAEIHFGADDNTPAAQLAMRRVYLYEATRPGTPENPGGPGPVR
jgi:hypothetical protein